MTTPLKYFLIGIFRAYQYLLSPFMPASCRFYPSCSHYAVEALQQHGALKGGWLTLRRLARCHPWGAFGFDPVPPHEHVCNLKSNISSDPREDLSDRWAGPKERA